MEHYGMHVCKNCYEEIPAQYVGEGWSMCTFCGSFNSDKEKKYAQIYKSVSKIMIFTAFMVLGGLFHFTQNYQDPVIKTVYVDENGAEVKASEVTPAMKVSQQSVQ